MTELLNQPVARSAPTASADQLGAPYAEAVRAFAAAEPRRFTVPGHKGGPAAPRALSARLGGAETFDLPLLIPGVDRPAGDGRAAPLERAERRAARAWGAARTWFLTAGATQGNLAACLAVAQGERRVAVQRTSHGSTFNGVALAGLLPTSILPAFDRRLGIAHGVTPAALDDTLRRAPGIRAVFVVSPTYYGVCADAAGLAEVAHRHGAALIVDEAWGAHLRFSSLLPTDAISAGADLVISSTHKHLGSLGGSAMLHRAATAPDWLGEGAIDRALGLVTSTSPSSLLMASLDLARARAESEGEVLLESAVHELAQVRDALRSLPGLDVIDDRLLGHPGVHGIDPLRLCLDVRRTGLTGLQLAARLRAEDGIELELAQDRVIVAIFGLGESPATTAAPLIDGLARLSRSWADRDIPDLVEDLMPHTGAARGWTPRDALWAPSRLTPVERSDGRIAAEAIVPYPPGIPVVLPGEVIDGAVLGRVRDAVLRGVWLRGASDPTLA
ncbi:MAG: aminotransferase class I/II-fold pyridoxal phosphate-dependent enzyme, partial [Solirubrobacteraceae bacterium]|nr:aminotransferase class I/II-fold pyridoxal phosphate-dependent enzyme [Solirubrobacteraceae bacterium]